MKIAVVGTGRAEPCGRGENPGTDGTVHAAARLGCVWPGCRARLGTVSSVPGFSRSFAALALALWPLSAGAQDTRTVSEPVIPPVCAALGARLAVVNGRTVAPEDERRPDTARIQQALDGCPAGQAVELRPEGGFAAFLAGPLQLRAGVTLLVARGAILFGSRDPRDYDATPEPAASWTPAAAAAGR